MCWSSKNYTIEINNFKDSIITIFIVIDNFYQGVTSAHIKNYRNIDKAII